MICPILHQIWKFPLKKLRPFHKGYGKLASAGQTQNPESLGITSHFDSEFTSLIIQRKVSFKSDDPGGKYKRTQGPILNHLSGTISLKGWSSGWWSITQKTYRSGRNHHEQNKQSVRVHVLELRV